MNAKWFTRALTLVVSISLASAAAMADPPEGKGKGKGKSFDKGERSERRDDRDHDNRSKGAPPRASVHFVDQHRTYVRDYYAGEYKRGFCPPGLAKKNNGCMPPGQAKKWQVGRPLPRDVIFYDLPPQLVVQIGTPPAGHRFVRVASDILLIAIGTGIVIDAIQDLGRM